MKKATNYQNRMSVKQYTKEKETKNMSALSEILLYQPTEQLCTTVRWTMLKASAAAHV